MAYRNPAFYLWHDLAEATTVNISAGSTKGSKGNAYDYRQDELLGWPSEASPNAESVAAEPRAEVSSGVYQFVDTLIIPAGSVFSGTASANLVMDVDATYATSPQTYLAPTPIDETLQVLPLSSPAGSTSRGYCIIQLIRDTTSTVEIGELYLSEKREMSRGPDPGWDISSRSHSTDAVSMAGVESSRITGASVTTFRLKWNALGAADMVIIDDLLTLCGTARPFYFAPPDDRYPEVMLCKLSRDPQMRQRRSNPGAGIAYDLQLDLIEVTG